MPRILKKFLKIWEKKKVPQEKIKENEKKKHNIENRQQA